MSDQSPRRFHGLGDFSDRQLDAVLADAARLNDGLEPEPLAGVLGLAMLEPSLRTRTGFAAAAYRQGLNVVEVDARRSSARSMPEGLNDTIRTFSGYVDALVVRADRPSPEFASWCTPETPWLNAGDAGPLAEHPSQALIDLFAIERLAGPIGEQHVVLCGDLRMRAARSLLHLLARRPPRSLTLLTDDSLRSGLTVPPGLAHLTTVGDRNDLSHASVLYAVGIPHGAADEHVRAELRVDARMLAGMSDAAIVLSPMPVIDEIASAVRRDPRMRYFEQSDLGLPVRMALLRLLFGRLT